MAELRPHPPAVREATSASVNWSLPDELDDLEEQPKGCIELRGLSYLAFCKAWGPLFVKPEEDEEL